MALDLSPEERAIAGGHRGGGAAIAMRIVAESGRLLGAPRLIPIASAHIDGALYHGDSGTLFAERLVEGGAKAAVRSTLNVGALDLMGCSKVRLEGVPREMARRMTEEAARRGLVLAVDHTFVHTGAVRKMRELAQSGLGDIYYYDSVRVNLGLFQHDVSVIWDLAVHDLSIMDYVLCEKPVAVSATGMSHVAGEPENIAYLNLFFDSKMIAHVHVNWLAPVKVRRTLLGGSAKMVVYDDLEPSEKVKVYDKGITLNGNPQKNGEKVYQMLVGYRTGDMWAPQLDMTEALGRELREFADCVEHGGTPVSDGHAGLRVVRILEAASQSLAQRGRVIELEQARRIA